MLNLYLTAAMSTTNSLTSPTLRAPRQDIDRKLVAMQPESPFGDMALALSGGGFRAAAFSLGSIAYLNRIWINEPGDTLLKHITFITSTSGGTLANAFYSASLFKPGFVFDNFYQKMRLFMDGENLLEEVCNILNDPKKWDETGEQSVVKNGKTVKVKIEKSHNLINSFAKAYDKLLFSDHDSPGNSLFDVYFNRDANPHLQTVCFNATELNNGLSFRFQTNGDPSSIRTVGNYYLHFNNADIARKLKLGDLAATSSCFPSGFEPMIYPNDYIHPGLNDVNQMLSAIDYKNNDPLKLDTVVNQPFCMVDGGVVDNQGLYSMMMEDTYRADNPPKKQFDLMMVCDVGSYFMDAYRAPGRSEAWWRNFNINGFKKLMPIGVLMYIISGLLVALTDGILRRLGLLLLLPSGIYTILYLLVIVAYNKALAGLKNSFGKVIVKIVGFFFHSPFYNLQQMIATRVNSTLLITTDIFLKQIRRQYYSDFYGMPAYRNRVLSNFIYEFSAQHSDTRIANLQTKDAAWWKPPVSENLTPGVAMQQMATNATSMGTTLWFEEDQKIMRDYIIACGQFSMCYNLLKHIYRLEVLDVKWQTDTTLQGIKGRLLNDWSQFKLKPDFMVDDLSR